MVLRGLIPVVLLVDPAVAEFFLLSPLRTSSQLAHPGSHGVYECFPGDRRLLVLELYSFFFLLEDSGLSLVFEVLYRYTIAPEHETFQGDAGAAHCSHLYPPLSCILPATKKFFD